MRVKGLIVVAMAAALVSMPVVAGAAGSPSRRPSSSGSSGSSGGSGVISSGTIVGGSSDTVSTGSGTATVGGTQVIVAGNGTKLNVSATTTSSSGTVTALVSSNAEVTAAVGESKTAGLPDGTVSVIRALDSGNLSAVPGVDLSGKNAYGSTVALRAEAGNQPTTLYVSGLPENGVASILFYNNGTGTWTVITATVDPATNTVSFVAPYSGTAIVIG